MGKIDFNQLDINHFSDTPLYKQLADFIQKNIEDKTVRPGDLMTPENTICEILDLSRSTVRNAIQVLVDKEILVRHQGKGTYVSSATIPNITSYTYDFTSSAKSIGAMPSSKVIINEVLKETPEDICNILGMAGNDKTTFHLRRLRLLDDEPIMLEDVHIPYYLCPGMEKYDFSHLSLYEIFSSVYNIPVAKANETLTPGLVTEYEAKYLGVNPNSACANIKRTAYLSSGVICEYTTSTTRADKITLRMSLKRNAMKEVTTGIQRLFYLKGDEA